ncbi:MAG: hypothetical protein QOG39_113 [Acidimicrobiaceae bacterium]
MSRRRKLGALALVVVLGLGWAYQAQSAPDVAHIGFVGWWSKRPGAMPTPTDTSFEIASGVDGTESVAAFRILINGAVTKATIVLSEASATSSVGVGTPKLQVCPTSSPWLKINAGQYADAPKPDCTHPVPLTRDATKLTWTADVTSALAGPRSELSLMVVPAPDTTLPVPPTYFVTFATPRVDAQGTPDVVPVTTSPPRAPTVTVPVVATPSQRTPSVGPSGPVATVATTAPTATSAPAPQAAAPAPARFGVPAATKKTKPWGKLLVLVPISVLAGAAYTLARKRLLAAPT